MESSFSLIHEILSMKKEPNLSGSSHNEILQGNFGHFDLPYNSLTALKSDLDDVDSVILLSKYKRLEILINCLTL